MAGGKLQLVNLIRKTYDFLSWREAITRLYEVKRRNGGRLVGLKISKFLLILSKIQYDYEYWKDRILSKKFGKVEASRTCFICYRIFYSQFSRNRHVKIVHTKTKPAMKNKTSPLRFQCSFCSNIYLHKASLKRHNLQVHYNLIARNGGASDEMTSKLVCSFCSKVFKYDVILKDHVKYYHNPESRRCFECNQIFTRRDSLLRHLQNVHGLEHTVNIDLLMAEGSKLMQCEKCKVTFVDKNNFLMHLKRKACGFTLTKDGKYICQKCPKSYFYKFDLRRHTKDKHGSL